jgi:hypothetical protein
MTMVGGGSTGPLSDSAIVAVVVPDGFAAPTLIESDGATSAMPVSSNVSAEIVPLGSSVQSGAATLTIPGPATLHCSPPQSRGAGTRCRM